MSNMCECGHDKWSHAISLKGVVGSCLKEIIKDWEYCGCLEFRPALAAPDLRHVCADRGNTFSADQLPAVDDGNNSNSAGG